MNELRSTEAGKNSLSRRDFLKLAGLAAGSSAIELGSDWLRSFFQLEKTFEIKDIHKGEHLHRVLNRALLVVRDLVEAEKSNDPDKKKLVQKEVVVWLFAEVIANLIPPGKYEKSSALMYHFLNGDGQPVNISSEIISWKDEPIFWKECVKRAVWNFSVKDIAHPYDNFGLSKKTVNAFFRHFASSINQGFDFHSVVNGLFTEGEGFNDFYYMLGACALNIKAHASHSTEIDESNKEISVNLSMEDAEFSLYDVYSFRRNRGLRLDMDRKVTDFINSHSDDVEAFLRSLELPEPVLNKILDYYYSFSETIVNSVSKLEEGVTPSGEILSEKDLSILEERLGAREFKVFGGFAHKGKMDVRLYSRSL